jgi:hypothetical protein
VASWWWSWLLTIVGVTGFLLVGTFKKWWGWYINIGCQFLWAAYSILTEQWGFLAACGIYFAVFMSNAIRATREHLDPTYGFDFNEVAQSPDIDRGPHPGFSFGFRVDESHEGDGITVINKATLDSVFTIPEVDYGPGCGACGLRNRKSDCPCPMVPRQGREKK